MRWGLIIIGAILVALTAVPQARYGAWQDPDTTYLVGGYAVPYGLAAGYIVLHLFKVLLPAVAVTAWGRSQRLLGVGASLLFIALGAISISNTASLFALTRAEKAGAASARSERTVDLRAELAGLQQRLMMVGWARPSAQIQADIAATKRSRAFETSNGCVRVTSPEPRRLCAEIDRLVGEQAAATEAEGLRKQEREIRQALAIAPARTTDRPHPDVMVLHAIFGLSEEIAVLVRVIGIALVLELAEGAAFAFATALKRRATNGLPTPSAPPPTPPTQPRRRYPVRRRSINRLAGSNCDCGSRSRSEGRSAGCGHAPGPTPTLSTAATRPTQQFPARSPKAKPTLPSGGEVRVLPGADGPAGSASTEPRPRPRAPTPHEANAVRAFVESLPRFPEAKVAGRPLFEAYDRIRRVNDWPPISPAHFGMAVASAVHAIGGYKMKSNRQVYVDIGLPPLRPSGEPQIRAPTAH